MAQDVACGISVHVSSCIHDIASSLPNSKLKPRNMQRCVTRYVVFPCFQTLEQLVVRHRRRVARRLSEGTVHK